MTLPLRRTAPLFPFIVVLLVASAGVAAPRPLKIAPLDIATARGDFHFQVEVADTPASRERGLMFRKSLGARSRHAVRLQGRSSRRILDEEHPHPARHAVHRGRWSDRLHRANASANGRDRRFRQAARYLAVLELQGGRAAEIDAEPGDQDPRADFSPVSRVHTGMMSRDETTPPPPPGFTPGGIADRSRSTTGPTFIAADRPRASSRLSSPWDATAMAWA